jgi:CRISPR system Cascade subunit CasB
MNKAERVYAFVAAKIGALQKESPWGKAMLAKLRRGIGKEPGEMPDIWEVTLGDLPEALMRQGKDEDFRPTEAEWAIHTALTLYALHQQGKDQPMSVSGKKEGDKIIYGASLGKAARQLIKPDKSNEQAVKRRFDAMATAKDLTELSHHARGLIQLMKAADPPIRLDYPQFAKDLYFYQFDDARDKIRLRWGQDFYRADAGNEQEESKVKEGEQK